MKKIISVALAVVLAMALAVSALAADAITFDKPLTLGIYVHEGAPEQTVEVTGTGAYKFDVSGLDVNDPQWFIIKNTDEVGWPPVVNPSAVPDGAVIRISELVINGEAVTFDGAEYYDYVVANNGVIEINFWNDFASGILGMSCDKDGAFNSVSCTVVIFKDAAEAAEGVIPTTPVAEEAPADEPAEEPAPEANGTTVIASADVNASTSITVLDGADYTNPDLFLNIYYDVVNTDNIGWGPGALCDKNWTTIIDNNYAANSFAVVEDGIYTIALTEIAAAFEAAGADPAEGIILNWWADYATLTKVELVTVGEAPAAPEAPAEPEVETEEPEVEAEETPADTGLALSLIPAAIAMAVVVLKRR